MVTLTNGKRSKTEKRRSEKGKTDELKSSSSESDSSDSASNQDSDQDPSNQEPEPQESFEERLKILKINNHDPSNLSSNPSQLRIPVNSLAQTLIQALNSSDHQLLDSCLIQSNKQLIINTIQRIPTSLVHNLIEHLIIGLNKKRGHVGEGSVVSSVRRTRTLIEWVRQLLLVHMSYLITIPALVSKLTILHSSLQKRLNLHSKLLSLNGRLELILNQIERNKSGLPQSELSHEALINIKLSKPNLTKAKQKIVQPPVKYVEGESTDDEDEDETMETKKTPDGSDEDSEDDGSVEDVVLGSESGSDDEDGSSDEDDLLQRKAQGKVSVSEGLFDLEAELSGSEEDEEDEEEDEDDQDEDDENMADFIDDGSGDESDENESD
ncbi:hypothetical protein DFH28DRAFT_522032 [Melampsora americana]|nr:hypothetical protein DFH28DRAFT_522032 [Melampsora americana]